MCRDYEMNGGDGWILFLEKSIDVGEISGLKFSFLSYYSVSAEGVKKNNLFSFIVAVKIYFSFIVDVKIYFSFIVDVLPLFIGRFMIVVLLKLGTPHTHCFVSK